MLVVVGPGHARAGRFPTWRQVRSVVVLAALLLVGGNGLLSLGEKYVDSGLAALIVATVPVWMVAINAVVTRVPVSRSVLAALVLGTIGVGVLLGGPGGRVHVGGAVVVLISAVFWGRGRCMRAAPRCRIVLHWSPHWR